ncbi:YncE family protein [Streptomyces decoyicus]|uniref:YncE family protein n=1 Tax=Streptomyces decoyicus TaxID=249567 RepID=UPI00382121DD
MRPAHAKSPRLIPAGDGPLSIALSRDGRTAYAAGQADCALSLIDLRKGVVTKTVPTGAGALSVTTDPASGRALVANRTAATVTVVGPHKGTVVNTLTTGAIPHHVERRTAWRTWSKSRVPDPRARMPCAASASGADGRRLSPARRPGHVVRST